MIIEVFFVFILGLVIGSFLTALTYRWPEQISLSKGRSKCPKCKTQIDWYDNVPLFSYLLLRGKCRNCEKKISIRYPLIELSTGLLFTFAYIKYDFVVTNLKWLSKLPTPLGLLIFFIIIAILVGIFVVDFEHHYIPDYLIFFGIGLLLIVFLITNNEIIYTMLLGGLLASLFLLSLHLITFGKGMGLGDVKLAIFMGTMFSIKLVILWLFLSFVIGSIIGIVMLCIGAAKLKQQIPFGPFLVLSAFGTIFGGQQLLSIILPFMF